MKSSEYLLLFFIFWSTFLECVIIYQWFKRRDIEKEMGLGITMRKLPRSRMKKAAENVLMGYNRTGNHFRNGSISLRKSLSQAEIFTNRKNYNKLEEE